MIYLDEVVIHNFRSFRHAAIKFNKGFNCIIGPNGSGKSSIANSLIYALGEKSLKRLDVQSSTQLINALVKPSKEDRMKRAYARIKFSGDHDLEVIKTIRSDKKVGYRLNGKKVTREKVIEVLRDAKCEVNQTNTITQSETKRLLSLNPRERRMLIDTAAGISEFNEKRDSAIHELDKVQEKINLAKVQLQERAGFLSGLEKEKADAEAWTEMNNKVRSTEYTILQRRVSEINSGLAATVKAATEGTQRRQDVEQKLAELESRISQHMGEKDLLSKSWASKSAEASSNNGILQEINKGIAIASTQRDALNENMAASSAKIEDLQAAQKKAQEEGKSVEESIGKLTFEVGVKSKGLPKAAGESDPYDDGSANEKYIRNSAQIQELSKKLIALTSEFTRSSSDHDSISKNILELQNAMNVMGQKRSGLIANIKAKKEAVNEAGLHMKEQEKELPAILALQEELSRKQGANSKELMDLKYALASRGGDSSDRVADALRKAGKGILGRADALCTYDDKYALAVQAAAGSRLGNFIAEDVESVKAAIAVLKSQKLGRATFIPLDEIRSKPQKGEAKGMRPLIDFIKFEKKYQRAFEYIFSNTYLVDDIPSAQKVGLGTYRFVTLEGEVVEPSGAITGGSMKVVQTIAAIEARVKRLESDAASLSASAAETATTVANIRKKIAEYETGIGSRNVEITSLLSMEDEVNRDIDSTDAKIKSLAQDRAKCDSVMERAKREKDSAEKEVAVLNEDNTSLGALLKRIASEKGSRSKAKEEASRIEALRNEIESLNVQIGSLKTRGEMLKTEEAKNAADLKQERSNLTILKGKLAQLAKDMEAGAKKRAELEQRLQADDKNSSGIYKQMADLDAKIGKLTDDKVKLAQEQQRLARELVELEGKRSNFETRLTDVKAQLMAYQNQQIAVIEDVKTEELERQRIILKDRLDKLGNVNLKAPEAYAEKKKDVDEAQQKLETLGNERSSILSMIGEIDSKKSNVFSETLRDVNENFKRLYGYLFTGEAALKLKDPSDPFNSGLLIETTNKEINADTASGGQKSLLSLMLIFAIQMRNPLSFYIFDEIDISLDPENAKKLSKLIKELSAKSQFIVVSHNNSLISEADTAIGVAKGSNGSQTFGLEVASSKA